MNARRRLLAVADIPIWPIIDGFSVRAAGLLRELACDWEIDLIAPQTPGHGLPFEVAGAHDFKQKSEKQNHLDRLLSTRPPDAILWWMELHEASLPEQWWSRTVVDQVDSRALTCWREAKHSEGVKQKVSWLGDAWSLAKYERHLARSTHAVTVVGEDDARVIRRLSRTSNVHIVPNGVDIEDRPRNEASDPRVVFTGVMNYTPNVDAVCYFAEQIWPKILSKYPNAQFVIGGRNPNEEVYQLADNPGVQVVPDIPEMKPFLNQAWISVAPMRQGAGIKNKVLEAWSVGVPTILSSIAVNGLDLSGDEPWVVSTEAAWVEVLDRLLANTGERLALGEAMRERARSKHSWPQAVSGLRPILDSAVEGS